MATQDSHLDVNVVDLWLRKDPTRWMAGILGGIFAGLLALAVAAMMAMSAGHDALFPAKLMATSFMGAGATDFAAGSGSSLFGIALFAGWGALWGFVFGHFVATNKFWGLFGMGLTWGIYTWIFNWNLFFQSFRPLHAAGISSGAAFPVCLTFGLGMMSVGIFDRVLRGNR